MTILGGVFVLGGVCLAWSAHHLGAVGAAAMGTAMLVYVRTLMPLVRAVQLNNLAVDATARGDMRRARAALDEIGPAHGSIAVAVGAQRTILAIAANDPAAAIRFADATLALKRPRYPAYAGSARAFTQSMRALAHAMLGNGARTAADVEAVRRDPYAGVRARSQATLAEAVSAAKGGDMVALGQALDANPRALHGLVPRERALLRALTKMARRPDRGAYRAAASADFDPPSDWATSVVPEAHPFAAAVQTIGAPSSEAGTGPGRPPAADETTSHGTARSRTGRLELTLGGGFVLLFTLLVVVDAAVRATFKIDAIGVLTLLALGLSISAGWRSHARLDRCHLLDIAAERALAEKAGEVEALAHLRQTGAIALWALRVARSAEHRTELERALAACYQGLTFLRARSTRRVAAADLVMPGLLAERAFVLAALGRASEADAELATLKERHAGYAYLALATQRVGLVRALQTGDRALAVALAESRSPELPLPLFDDVLGDAVRALASNDAAHAARARDLALEIDSDPEMAKWIGTMAPDVMRELRATSRPAGT